MRANRAERRLAELIDEVAQLRGDAIRAPDDASAADPADTRRAVPGRTAQSAGETASVDPPPEDAAGEPAARLAAERAPPETLSAAEADDRTGIGEEDTTPIASAEATASPQPVPRPSPVGPGDAEATERRFAGYWLVWIGGLALALGGVFLVKTAIDMGLVTPALRIAGGGLLGLVLLAAGEWLRRNPPAAGPAAAQGASGATLPLAATSAGLVTWFATGYAAYSLYGFMGDTIAFAVLAAVSLVGVLLALLHGPVIGMLGMVGAYGVPALVGSADSSLDALLLYLAVVAGFGVGLVRARQAWWPVWITTVGATVWSLLVLGPSYSETAPLRVALYLLAVGGLHQVLLARVDAEQTVRGILETAWRPHDPRLIPMMLQRAPTALGIAVLILLAAAVRSSGYAPALVVADGVALAGALAVAIVWRCRSVLAIGAAVQGLALLALWHLPALIRPGGSAVTVEGESLWITAPPVVPPALESFVAAGLGLGALFVAAGAVALIRGLRDPVWPALWAAVPVLAFTIGYWRIEDFGLSMPWAVAAIVLAAMATLAARHSLGPRIAERDRDLAVALHVAAAAAFLALGLVSLAREAWLTVAFSIEVAVLAWLLARLGLPALRYPIAVLLGVVAVRLLANPYVLDYDAGGFWPINWTLYAFGLPMLLFDRAARLVDRRGEPLLAMALEAAAAVFAAILVMLEARLLFHDGIGAMDVELAEGGAVATVWALLGLLLLRRAEATGRRVPLVAGHVVSGLAVMLFVLSSLLVANPLLSGQWVGDTPILNQLGIGYALPALAFALGFLEHARRGETVPANIAGTVALVGIFSWLTLELRVWFQGPQIGFWTGTGESELYAYSVLWLLLGLALLCLAWWTRSRSLRYASLLVVGLTVTKAFLVDMSALTGLYRAFSFIGLGASLLGLGFVYQRYILPDGDPGTPADPETRRPG